MSVTPTAKAIAVVNEVAPRRGQFIHAAWQRRVKTLAAHKERVLVKHVTGSVRVGAEFANMAVNEGRETGPLPWGAWLVYPFILAHKGEEYLRATPQGRLTSTYTLDGVEVSREAIAHMLPKSGSGKPDVINVNIDDLREIGSLVF